MASALEIPQRVLPDRQYVRKPGAGRPPKPARQVFEGIMYVLRTACQWKALPVERFSSASAIHKRFLEWEEAGFSEALWKAGLAEYDDMAGIAWRWQSVDGAMMKAPLAQEAVHVVDRRKEADIKRRDPEEESQATSAGTRTPASDSAADGTTRAVTSKLPHHETGSSWGSPAWSDRAFDLRSRSVDELAGVAPGFNVAWVQST